MIALALILALASVPSDLVREGGDLYAVNCLNCHGSDLRGTDRGPSLQGAGAAAVDFMLTTGRMPLEVPETEPLPAPPQLNPHQIQAVTAYVLAHGGAGGPSIPTVHHSDALMRGRVIFEEDCQACHGAMGDGAVAGFGWLAPPLQPDDPVQIAEAVRIGPGIMPEFSEHLLSQSDLDALVAYVASLRAPPDVGGYSLESSGPVGEGLVGWIFGVVPAAIVMVLVGETLKTRRHPPRDEPP